MLSHCVHFQSRTEIFRCANRVKNVCSYQPRIGMFPLTQLNTLFHLSVVGQVVCKDFPRPAIDTSPNYLEAAALSAYLRYAPRPEKPLKIVIAGAGKGFHTQIFS